MSLFNSNVGHFVSFSEIMSTVMSQQPPKEDEEEEDEERGEEFLFEDSMDEEKLQEDSKGTGSVRSDQSKKEDRQTSDSVPQTGTDSTQLLRTSPSAGQEDIPTKDVASISPPGNTFSGILYILFFLNLR